ncbi:MAG: type II secretion system protein GspH [Candidatus Competibacteraceae bacterium]|nr:MAG: type II secretion system protein GspH [Candidatus Competibacteraceae bacterium]
MSKGFTLLEVMVVMILVGIMTGFALLSIGGGTRDRLVEEARRLAALVELHQQEAILNGETRGIRFDRASYALLSLDDQGRWRPPVAATTLVRRQLPEGLTLGLWIEGRPVAPDPENEQPQVLLLASGETTEFVAIFGFADDAGPNAPRQRVAGDALGRLTVDAVGR